MSRTPRSGTLHHGLLRRSPKIAELEGAWMEDVSGSSAGPVAARRRAAELARPATESRRVLLRYDDGQTDLVVVTRDDIGEPPVTAPPPAWGLGSGSGGLGTHLAVIDETGDETSWLVALAVTLGRYDPESAPVVGTVRGSFTASLEGTLAEVRPAPTDQPAAVGLLFTGERFDGEYVPCLTPPFPLTVSVFHDERGPRLRLDHSTGDFAPEIAEQFARHLRLVHRQVRRTPDIEVADVELMDHVELLHVAGLGRSVPLPAPTASTIHEAFGRIAAGVPDAVAITDGSAELTYRELDERSSLVAQGLRTHGVRDGDRVGVCLDRSTSFVVTALGILKAGAAYVPMDPAHPAERLAYTAQDGDLALVVTDRPSFGHATVVAPEALVTQGGSPVVSAGTVAYLIYTSGSTGRPKGVVVPHGNVIALVDATRDEYGLGRGDVWTWFHSGAFDFSVWEIWGCLLTGGRLVVVPYAVSREPDRFRDLLRAERVTVLSQTPSAFAQLLGVDHTGLAVRLVVFGGEPLDTRMLPRWFDRHPESRCRMVNMFGITETTVHVTARTVTRADALAGSRSVGRALPGWHLYVLDRAGRLVPPGVAGEICVGGAGVAAGYFHRADLTAERFVPDPCTPATMYRSGDLGRLRPDGDLEHLGRIDNQVKIRGFRIELDEIRSVLLEDPRVSAATVVVRRENPGDAAGARIDGYVVLTGPAGTRDVRERAARVLPEHMVPSTITELSELPLTVNGKIDQERLPRPTAVIPSDVDSIPTGDHFADRLRIIWSTVIGVPVGMDDDFFELGGNSLLAVRIGAAMRAEGLPALRLRELYRHPTVRGAADAVRTTPSE
ncbi:amino acid adenylation domain-containing protein [Lentzea sp. NBC_00516]|uniref:non-ribosomal peptide synthetase n=1 Tax=Lentzea sp. NBC_00516 TaxID=2903582 RepID=UPI002E817325|nr:amino acid adenylation domain-containing protein [Lentzea sp. NBC_00516]WUD28594.1 amino acid adenylation domain-containing protein [Lentzea sp. NBC_00516]